MYRYIKLLLSILILCSLFSCGGGGGGQSTDTDSTATTDTDTNPPPSTSSTEYFSGFDFSFSAGDYWDYYWSSSSTSGSQDGSSSNSDSGSFRITLGNPVTINGIDAFPLQVTGKTTDSDDIQYAPEWTHIAISENTIWGSSDGSTLDIIFIAGSTQWTGGGFFTDFGSNEIKASSKYVSNDYISTSAIGAERSQSQSKCTYYSGYGTICPSDESFTISETEYYKAGIGPIAYRYSLSYSNDGGGYTTWRRASRELGLVATNLSSPDGFQPTLPPWTQKTPLSSSIESGYSAAAIDGKIYLTGGQIGYTRSSALNIYDPATDTWSSGSAMPYGRYDHAGTAINGKLYVSGGYATSKTDTILEYNPATNHWSTVSPSMAATRAGHVSVEIDNALLMLGGVGMSSVEFVYPDSDVNGLGEAMPIQMNYMGGSATGSNNDRRIYIMGGVKYNALATSCNEGEYLSYCYKLNPFTWEWTSCSRMPTVRADLTVVTLENKLYAIGGRNCSGKTNVVEVYDPASNSWDSVSPMLYSAVNTCAAAVNGKIYVFYANDNRINVEEYDPTRE